MQLSTNRLSCRQDIEAAWRSITLRRPMVTTFRGTVETEASSGRYLRRLPWLLIPGGILQWLRPASFAPSYFPSCMRSFHVSIATVGLATSPSSLDVVAFFAIRLATDRSAATVAGIALWLCAVSPASRGEHEPVVVRALSRSLTQIFIGTEFAPRRHLDIGRGRTRTSRPNARLALGRLATRSTVRRDHVTRQIWIGVRSISSAHSRRFRLPLPGDTFTNHEFFSPLGDSRGCRPRFEPCSNSRGERASSRSASSRSLRRSP